MAVDAINRYGWTSSIGTVGRHHSVRPPRLAFLHLISLYGQKTGCGCELSGSVLI